MAQLSSKAPPEAEARFLAAKEKYSSESALIQRTSRRLIGDTAEELALLSLAKARYKAACKEWYQEQKIYDRAVLGLGQAAGMSAENLLEQIRLVVNTSTAASAAQAARIQEKQELELRFGKLGDNSALAVIAEAARARVAPKDVPLVEESLEITDKLELFETPKDAVVFTAPVEECEHGVPLLEQCSVCDIDKE